jgi:hypothetical protein
LRARESINDLYIKEDDLNNEIAKKESLTPDEAAVADQMKNVLAEYKEADPVRVRVYIESVLRNAQVMEFLESQ